MSALQKQYIFLVDDEPIQNEMLHDYLSEKFPDYAFKMYDSGEAAMKDMGLRPRFVVLDYHLNAHLPDAQNGVEVLKEIKEAHPEANVIMLSGQDAIGVAVESMKYGAFDYVIKGETAFSRMETVINNYNELDNIKKTNKTFKSIIAALVVSLLLVVGLALFMVVKLR